MNESKMPSMINGHPRRTEPLRAERKVPVVLSPEAPHRQGKIWKKAAQLMMAASCIIAPLDLAVSDAATAKIYNAAQENITVSSDALGTAAKGGATAGFIIGNSLVLGQAISRNKKLRNSFEDFEAYSEQQRANRGTIKKALFKIPNAPLVALNWIGEKAQHAGEWAGERKSKIVQRLGRVAIDTAQVNTIGTSGVILQETMNDKPTSLKRQVYLSGLIAGSWVGGAEVVRKLYQNAPTLVQTPMAAFGQTFETLTSPNFINPSESPLGTIAMTAVAAGFARWGWKIEEFRQQREQLLTVPHEQIMQAVEEQQHRHH